MDYNGYVNWLKTEKKMKDRSANDAASRLKRALQLISESKVGNKSLDKLNATPEFLNLSMSVKSQLRRSIILYQEFINSGK